MPLRLWCNDDVALFSPHPNGPAPTPWVVEEATEFLVTYTLVVPPVPQALPLAPFMTVTITSLSPHPSVNISANIAEVGNSGSSLDPGRADQGAACLGHPVAGHRVRLSRHPGQRPERRSLTERRLVLLGAQQRIGLYGFDSFTFTSQPCP
jgi:hypothetical protein